MKKLITILTLFIYCHSFGQSYNNNQRIFNVKNFGAKGDGTYGYGVAMTNASTTLTCSSCSFTSADVGKSIAVNNAAGSSNTLKTTISSLTNSTTVVLANAASATISSDTAFYSTNDQVAIQAAITAASVGGGTVWLPNGIYGLWGALNGTSVSNLYIPAIADTLHKVTITIEGESVSGMGGSGYLLNFPAQNQLTGVILYSLTSGTGVVPAVIAPIGLNKNDVEIRNLSVMVYSNHGHTAVSMTGINGLNFQKISVKNCMVYPDIILTRETSPISSEAAGMIIGHNTDNGTNFITGNVILGFKYGMILSEHTNLDGNSIFGCVHGIVLPNYAHLVTGHSQVFACVNEIYSPTTTVNGQSAGTSHIDLKIESEWDTLTSGLSAIPPGAFYKSVYLVNDSSGQISGSIRFNSVANAGIANFPLPPSYGYDTTKLSISSPLYPYTFTNIDNIFRTNQTIKNTLILKNNASNYIQTYKSNSTFSIVNVNDGVIENDGNADILFRNTNSSGSYRWGNSTNLMTLNSSGQLGIGVTPTRLLDVPGTNSSNSIGRIGNWELSTFGLSDLFLGANLYYNGSNFTYRQSTYGLLIYALNGTFAVRTAPSGTAGNSATATQRIFANNTGDVSIGGGQTNNALTGASLVAFNSGSVTIGSSTDNSDGKLQITGNLKLESAGNKILITTGTNASIGVSTLSGGTVTVSTTAVTASSKIFVTHAGSSVTNAGTLYIGTITAATSFVITSTNASDNDTVNWWIIN